MIEHNRSLMALALATVVGLLAQACSDNGGTLAGEDITFDLIEATCNDDGSEMVIRMIDEAEAEEEAEVTATAREVLVLTFDPGAVALGEDIDLAADGAPGLVYSVEGPAEQLPERFGDSGARVLDGQAFEGTLVLDQATCEGPSVAGTIDAKLQTAAEDDTFQVDVAFTQEADAE